VFGGTKLGNVAISGTRTKKAEPLVLIVDDDDDTRNIVAEVLGWQGYRTAEAVDGVSALAAVAAKQPDAIILDVSLPRGMDGWEVWRRLQADPENRRIPVMILTAYAYVHDRDKAKQAGCHGFLTKPFSTDELTSELERAIDVAAKAGSGQAARRR
jgi:CheY-like chemotaxis protein